MKRHYKATFFEVLGSYPTERLLELLVQGNNPAKLGSWLRAAPEHKRLQRAFFVSCVKLA